jgi:hypothetical protein
MRESYVASLVSGDMLITFVPRSAMNRYACKIGCKRHNKSEYFNDYMSTSLSGKFVSFTLSQ